MPSVSRKPEAQPARPSEQTAIEALGRRASHGMRTSLGALTISVVLAAVKIVAGVVGHSYALIADGVESTLDVVSAFAVWAGLRVAAIPPDKNHPYGHGKAESMAAVFVAAVLLGTSLTLAVQSIRVILTPREAPAPFTLIVLVAVVATKEWLFGRLWRVGTAVDSTSLRADAWHHRSDALTSAAAFLGIALALLLGEGYESLDAWAALFACGIIFFNGYRILASALAEIMDRAAPLEYLERVRAIAGAVPGVRRIDKCFARKSGPSWLVDIHVMVDGEIPVTRGHAIGHDVKRALRCADIGVLDVLVHIEPAEETPGPVDAADAR
jgi:cation diffusion facilitator family transporter